VSSRDERSAARLLGTGSTGLTLSVAIAGIGVCVVSLVGFVVQIVTNTLPWSASHGVREYYQAIGQSYSQGFLIGFFLCFFLVMVAVITDRWWRGRKAAPSLVKEGR